MTGNRNSRWWSSKSEVRMFQLVEELATGFQIMIRGFRGRAIVAKEGLAVGIPLLRCVQVEICVLPVWRPPSWIHYFRLGWTVW